MAYDQMTIEDAASGHSILLNPVLDVNWEGGERIYRTVNGTVRPLDLPYLGPRRVTLRCCVITCDNADVITLHEWWHVMTRIILTDLAWAGAGTPATDSYVHIYEGIITDISEHAVQKGQWDDWTITIEVDKVTTQ